MKRRTFWCTNAVQWVLVLKRRFFIYQFPMKLPADLLSVVVRAKYVISKSKTLWNRDFHTYVIVIEILPLGSCFYCGRHISLNALVFSRSIRNKDDAQLLLVRDY